MQPSAPLVSFLLVAYRQERFIREAVASALAQTYSPLEIILSDDCSPDQTFAIMKEMAAHYRGPHALRLNRTVRNSGLTAHLNEAIALTQGRLIVLQAGDDISEPHRTATIVDRWLDRGRPSGSFFSAYREISELGEFGPVGGGEKFRTDRSWQSLSDRDPTVFGSYPGCTHALTRDIFEAFGPLPLGIVQEDICLQLRAALLGGIAFITQPLLRYRQTAGSQSRYVSRSAAALREARLRYLTSYRNVFSHFLDDCETAVRLNHLDTSTYNWARSAVSHHIFPSLEEITVLNEIGLARIAKLAAVQLPMRRKLILLRDTLAGRI